MPVLRFTYIQNVKNIASKKSSSSLLDNTSQEQILHAKKKTYHWQLKMRRCFRTIVLSLPRASVAQRRGLHDPEIHSGVNKN